MSKNFENNETGQIVLVTPTSGHVGVAPSSTSTWHNNYAGHIHVPEE